MSGSPKSTDVRKLPVPYRPKAGDTRNGDHFTKEWWSGERGGGKLPQDFEWNSNPKKNQEENGSSDLG